MKWLLIGIVTAVAAAAETPAERAQTLNTQGNLEAEKGNYAEARRMFEEAIPIWQSLGAGFNAHRAASLLNLGVTMSGHGQRQAAAKLLEEALVLHKRTLGPRHYRTLTNTNLLASNCVLNGDLERAAALAGEALPIERELYPDDIQLSRTLAVLSNLAIRRGQGLEALAPAEEALRITVRATGEDGLDTALAYTSVAEAYRFLGKTERALPLYRRARFLYEKELGPDHPRVATLWSQEGLILMRDGNLSLAERAMARAVGSLRKTCPDCLLELSLAENNLGLLRLRQKRYREANDALTSAVELREKSSAIPGAELADSLQSLALAREKLHMPVDAERLHARAEAILSYR